MALSFPAMPPSVFWSYFVAVVLLIVGLVKAARSGTQADRAGRLDVLGSLCFGIPMGVFGVDHFLFPTVIASMIPAWIPVHPFFVDLVGVALIAAALAIVSGTYSVVASSLLSGMLFLFVLVIHIPGFVRHPGDRFALTIPLRDSSFAAGALAGALAGMSNSRARGRRWLAVLARVLIGAAAIDFGIQNFLHPRYLPVVPLRQLSPAWFPLPEAVSFASGAVLLITGAALIIGLRACMAAEGLGLFVVAVTILVYGPVLVANFADIATGMNYFADTLAFGGAALLLAAAFRLDAA